MDWQQEISKKIKPKLLEKRVKLLKELGEINHKAKSNLCNSSLERSHSSNINTLLDINIPRTNNLRKQIEKTNDALSRIDKKEYGFCKNCGEPIPIARLQAVLFADRCVNCKSEEEKRDTIVVSGEAKRLSRMVRGSAIVI